jgi:HSP20 family protein
MNLVKWNPFNELEDVSNRLNSLFGRLPARTESGQLALADWTPSVDISETDAAYLIKAEIPEVGKENVKVTLQNGMLTIAGERKQEKEEKNKKFHRIERSFGSFTRSFRVPEDADSTTVTAEFKDGVLNVTLPKSEKAQSKSIDVKIA